MYELLRIKSDSYYYLEYSLNSTLSSSRPPTAGTIDPDYKYISPLYRHLYPERCL